MPRIHDYDLDDDDFEPMPTVRRSSGKKNLNEEPARDRPSPHHNPRKVAEGQESFKCGHCRAFIGPTVSGGRHRNHCPLCLYSRHVDLGMPGDRRCECRSLMEPIGLATRRNGEEVIVHRCLGCGAVRVCRVAADDHPMALEALPMIDYPDTQDDDAVDNEATA